MALLYFILRLSCSQNLNLAVYDLQDPMTIQGWTVSNNGIVNSYQTTMIKCNQNLLFLNPQPNLYQKTFIITDQEYDQLYLEMDLYFITFSGSRIKILINSDTVFEQTFSTTYMRQNALCGDSDSQYTLYQKFMTQEKSLILQIQFISTFADSNLGVKNLNIYTNGYKLGNGCPMDMPYKQGTQCVQYCLNDYAYLGGDQMLECQSGLTGQSGLIGQYPTDQASLWRFTNSSPSTQESLYLTDGYLLKNNVYNNIMYSELFKSSFVSATQYYYITQQMQSTHKLQISLLFYILGDWDDGSQVGLYIISDSIYQNNMVKIFKQMGKYYSSTGSGIYYTKIVSNTATTINVRRTLITYQANFYSSQVKIGFSQQLIWSTAKYGFGNVYIYELSNDPKIVLSGIYGLPYKCIANYYAYNGYCVQSCPPYSFKDQQNNNCTDYSSMQSTIFSNTVTINRFGTYIIKEFYDNSFNWDTVKSLFQVILHPTKNYLNGQPFSFRGNKKILGGYSSWGWGTYGAQLNLPKHDQIRVIFTLYLIGDWQPEDTFSYYYDGNLGNTFKNNPNISMQGQIDQEQLIYVSDLLYHTQFSLSLLFKCQNSKQDSMLASCGISDLYVLADQMNDNLCSWSLHYYSYFTNNCEKCTQNFCQLYPNHVSPVPYKCKYGCLTCSSSSVCNTCYNLTGFQLENGGCTCYGGGYIQQGTCNKCHYSCKECLHTPKNYCLQCESTRTLTLNQCQCISGTVDIFSQSKCELIIDASSGQCHYSCATCIGPEYYNCITCPSGSNRTYKNWNCCPCNSQFADIGETICQFISCDASCLTCNGPLESNCLSCSINFKLQYGYCICDGLFNNIQTSQSCVPNSKTCYSSCLTCSNQTPQGCISCDQNQFRFLNRNEATSEHYCTCFDGYFESSSICQICDHNCLKCIDFATNCYQCDSSRGRVLNNMNKCVCMVGLNDQLNSSQCVKNLTICDQSCKGCFGPNPNQCLECELTFRILNNTTCNCRDGYFLQGTQCQKCNYSCLKCRGLSNTQCIQCDPFQFRKLNDHTCQCQEGYQESQEGNCVDCLTAQAKRIFSCQYKNAQDGVWTYGEQCDDNNNNSRDGCDNFLITPDYNCINILNQTSICYKCPENCQKCVKQQSQIICITCKEQYYNAISECIPCYEDFCLSCSNPRYCSVCMDQLEPILGKCNTCEYGYYYDNKQCIPKCGDGIITINEQCDDGNLQSGDGCSELCQVEQNFICQVIDKSHCFIQEQPFLLYEIQQSNNDKKEILIWTSQNVTYRNISLEIIDQPNIQRSYIVSGKDKLVINLKLNFNQSFESITIMLSINGVIINQYNQVLKSTQIKVTLRNIIFLTQQEIQTTQKTQLASLAIVQGLFFISTATIFIVGISQLISQMNLVQQLSYIQFINIQFPPNLIQFLDIFNAFAIAPIFENFSIQQGITQLAPKQQIFLEKAINALYLANMQGFLFILIASFIFYIFLKLSIYVIKGVKDFLFDRQIIQIKYYVYLQKIQLQLYKTSCSIGQEGFNQLFQSNCYDTQFAILLQLGNQNFDRNDLMISYLFAFLNQLFYFKFVGSKIKNQEIIDGRWQQFYSQLKLIAALIFIFAIVQLQESPLSQIFVISMTSLFTASYLFIVQPYKNVLRNYQLIIQEMSLSIASLTFLAYIYFPFSIDPKVLGWFHIMTLMTMLICSLAINLYSLVMNIKKTCCQ